jgi:hypothetical protein
VNVIATFLLLECAFRLPLHGLINVSEIAHQFRSLFNITNASHSPHDDVADQSSVSTNSDRMDSSDEHAMFKLLNQGLEQLTKLSDGPYGKYLRFFSLLMQLFNIIRTLSDDVLIYLFSYIIFSSVRVLSIGY